MKSTISKTSKTLATLALVLLTMTTNRALAQSYPPAKVLAAQWWQWVLAVPASENPLTDTTGQFAAVNQRGRVWFLAGNVSGGTTVRTISVPAGKALFFPIVNVFDVEDGIGTGGVKVFMVHQPLQVAQEIVSSIIATAYGLLVRWMAALFRLTLRTWSNPRPLVCSCPRITSSESRLASISPSLIPAIMFCSLRYLQGITPSTLPAASHTSAPRWM